MRNHEEFIKEDKIFLQNQSSILDDFKERRANKGYQYSVDYIKNIEYGVAQRIKCLVDFQKELTEKRKLGEELCELEEQLYRHQNNFNEVMDIEGPSQNIRK